MQKNIMDLTDIKKYKTLIENTQFNLHRMYGLYNPLFYLLDRIPTELIKYLNFDDISKLSQVNRKCSEIGNKPANSIRKVKKENAIDPTIEFNFNDHKYVIEKENSMNPHLEYTYHFKDYVHKNKQFRADDLTSTRPLASAPYQNIPKIAAYRYFRQIWISYIQIQDMINYVGRHARKLDQFKHSWLKTKYSEETTDLHLFGKVLFTIANTVCLHGCLKDNNLYLIEAMEQWKYSNSPITISGLDKLDTKVTIFNLHLKQILKPDALKNIHKKIDSGGLTDYNLAEKIPLPLY